MVSEEILSLFRPDAEAEELRHVHEFRQVSMSSAATEAPRGRKRLRGKQSAPSISDSAPVAEQSFQTDVGVKRFLRGKQSGPREVDVKSPSLHAKSPRDSPSDLAALAGVLPISHATVDPRRTCVVAPGV